ncbi:hypothetical protein AKJ38_02965 [candidate division MSBL1 archaeon SCGC-AAA259I14]|uniref:Uncharacterized protein n=1 Tax=candidate division MSBL1 archaeon SCGC-AAA259I14 TaxID=1698268 RepID=A0A133UR59_9EURY|nr:hypothetical protein AKJ38_02965 [candidate division MSBL1 archaeon SCGC-AAA259I14]
MVSTPGLGFEPRKVARPTRFSTGSLPGFSISHRSSDPPPGWIVMWREFKKVPTRVEGYVILSF